MVPGSNKFFEIFHGTFFIIKLGLEKPAKQQSDHNPLRFVIYSIFLILNQVKRNEQKPGPSEHFSPTEPPK